MPRPITGFLVLLLAAASLCPAPARATWMVPGANVRPKDFAFFEHDGLYHIFYIRDRLDHPDSSGIDLGHAVSPDLWNWSQLPPVLAARPGAWDQSGVWAPTIVERDGVFSMLYTGVSTIPGGIEEWQSIGLATSTDLTNWTRLDAPVYACTQVPWTVCDSAIVGNAFRDPFVMPDPAHAGSWLLYYVTVPAADSGGMVVGVASSSGDFTRWSDAGSLWITDRAWSYGIRVESPHLFQHAGLWYLLFTTEASDPIVLWTGTDPVGDPSSWTAHGKLAWMLGTSTRGWAGTEFLHDGPNDYLAWYFADHIEIKRIVWGSDWRFSLTEPDMIHVRGLTWDRSSVAAGDTATLSFFTVNGNGSTTVELSGTQVDRYGVETPVALDTIGLPDLVCLTDDTTRVRWAARTVPGPGNSSHDLRLIVKLDSLGLEAPLLTVVRGSSPPVPDPAGVGERNAVVQFRCIGDPVGTAAELLIELREAAEAGLDLYDTQGRRVRNLAHRQLPRGPSIVSWDGCDGAGTNLPSGVYFARLALPFYTGTVRLIHLR